MSTNPIEPKALSSVKLFHELFGAYIGSEPHLPPEEVCNLRINLLQEELDELKQAISDGDIVEIADALADLQYVLSGAVISFGMQEIFADLFDEVQRSNMSKACVSEEEAQETQKKYEALDQTSDIIKRGEKYLVLRDGDKKALKSVNYSPADFDSILGIGETGQTK